MVVHDVPVNVIPKRLWDEYEEPEMPRFDVSNTKCLNRTGKGVEDVIPSPLLIA